MKFKLFFALSLLNIFLFAQNETVVIKLENNDYSLKDIDFGKNGFVISTGKYVIGDRTKTGYNLYYFKNNLEFDNLTTVRQPLSSDNQFQGSVISLNGNYLYYIAQDTYGSKKSYGQDVTQVNLKTKHQRKYRIERSKLRGNVEFEFCDDTYFYVLTIGYERDYNGKVIEGLPFYAVTKFKHDNFVKSEITLQLPKTGYNNKTKSFWKYSGHDENFIYMHRKKLQFKSGDHVYYIIALNKKDGSVSNQLSVPFSISPNYIQPSSNISIDYRLGTLFYSGFEFLNNFYSRKSKGSYRKFPRPGAFGSAKLDLESSIIYIYGVYGDEKYKGEDSQKNGFYVYGYDFEGEKKFEIAQDFTEDLIKEFSSVKENLHSMGLISLNVYDNHLELALNLVKEKRSTQRKKIILSKTGEFIKTVTIELLQKTKSEDPYQVIKKLIDNEKVLNFLKDREITKNDDENKLTVLKTSKRWDILKEVTKDSIILYSFEK